MSFIVQFAFHLIVVICADIILHYGWALVGASHITV